MKASERLRELGAKTDDPFWASEVPIGWLIDVGNALPLIADVVEAAETIKLPNPAFFQEAYEGEADSFMPSVEKLVSSLTALRDALEEK